MLRFAARISVRLAIVMGVCLMGPVASPPTPNNASADSSMSIYKPTTKLRKLHLVRPDLIPYPLASEIYC